jgi:hypothetical protein
MRDFPNSPKAIQVGSSIPNVALRLGSRFEAEKPSQRTIPIRSRSRFSSLWQVNVLACP